LKLTRESHVAASVREFYRTMGCKVFTFSDRRAMRAGQKGVPDMYVLPPHGEAFWHEAKSETGKLSPDQRAFIEWAARCDVRVVVGGLEDARAHWTASRLQPLEAP
jgi:hypothetical protein